MPTPPGPMVPQLLAHFTLLSLVSRKSSRFLHQASLKSAVKPLFLSRCLTSPMIVRENELTASPTNQLSCPRADTPPHRPQLSARMYTNLLWDSILV